MPRPTSDLADVLKAMDDLRQRTDARAELVLTYLKRLHRAVDRLSLPPGHDEHPEFDEAAPMWLLELHRDGQARGVYYPANCSTVAGLAVPTRHRADAMRFATLLEAERFIATDRRLGVFRIVPDRVEVAEA
jgi:hypothetical protein